MILIIYIFLKLEMHFLQSCIIINFDVWSHKFNKLFINIDRKELLLAGGSTLEFYKNI